jgi:hypothetical protein
MITITPLIASDGISHIQKSGALIDNLADVSALGQTRSGTKQGKVLELKSRLPRDQGVYHDMIFCALPTYSSRR